MRRLVHRETHQAHGQTGVSYTPELYLGSQVVAGYNYRFLCKAQVVVPGASETWAIVQIYEDLDGNATVTEVTNLTNEEAAQYGVEPATSETVQIANPFVDCDSFEAAATVAGFAITAPETVEAYPNRMIQAVADNMIQVFYTTGDLADERTEHILVRKAVGSEDVSGDYNDYASVTEQDINGTTVTLKGDGKLIYLAVWTDGDFSYSVAVSNGTDLDTMLKLANTLE